MSKEKQIEEMAKICCGLCEYERCGECMSDNDCDIGKCYMAKHTAEKLYNAGYRKQSDGEWIDADPNGHLYRFTCSLCGKTKLGKGTPYCPNCGAKMKGGAEE